MASPFWEADPVIGDKAAPSPAKGDSYFWSKDEIVKPTEKPGVLETAARSAVQGLTFGLADESYGLTQGIRGLLSGEGFSKGYERGVNEFRSNDKAGREANPVTGVLAEVAGGMGTGLGAMRAGATLMRGGMGLPQAMAASSAEGAGYGALHGAGNAEGGLQDRALEAGKGALTGAAVGAAVPVIARGVGAGVNALRSPASVPAERQAMVNTLRTEGVPITAGQATGSKPLLYAESILGDAPGAGGRSSTIMTGQGDAFTSAALRRAGGDGLATPDNMAANYQRLSTQFNDLSARNTLRADPELGNDINQALQTYGRKLPSEQRALVGNEAVEIVQRLQQGGGRMSGQDYQTIRSDLSQRAADSSDRGFGRALRGLRDALDDAMDRSIAPEDAGLWAETRRQYGNWKDLAKAAGGAGENNAHGRISPQALRSAVASGRNKEAYVRGEGDFADLVRAGNGLMTPLPNSGTAQRVTVGSGITGLAGALAGNGHLGSAALSAIGPGIAGRALLSDTMQAYLSRPELGPATRRAIEARLRAITQGGSQTQSQRLNSPRD